MRYLYSAVTDVGIRKKVNQDAALLIEAETENGPILFSVVCDGMGGLSSGEKASSMVIEAFEEWFENDLPKLLPATKRVIEKSLYRILDKGDEKVAEEGSAIGSDCGTTAAVLFLLQNEWLALNVGDSRIYHFHNGTFEQVTHDHSYVQKEIDEGRMTEEEAEASSMRSVLLQCIGAGDMVVPDSFEGTYAEGDAFLLCTDGFRHQLTQKEMDTWLSPDRFDTEEEIKEELTGCIEELKERKERDNITAVYIAVKRE